MSKVENLHHKWMKDDEDYRQSYQEQAEEFDLARAVIEARLAAGLTQNELAGRVATAQSVIARLESGGPDRLPKRSSVSLRRPALG
jgi:ribosome-binding protein aMBF1 (putative translation factor)